MTNVNLLYQCYQTRFLDGSLNLNRISLPSEAKTINEVTATNVERVENDIWHPKSEFDFALVMFRYNLDYKLNLPSITKFPAYVQITEHGDITEAFILNTIIIEVGGLEKAESIVQNKPRHAVGYTAFFHCYKGYTFNGSEWRKSDLQKPYDQRSKYVPINVLRNAVRLLSRSKQTPRWLDV